MELMLDQAPPVSLVSEVNLIIAYSSGHTPSCRYGPISASHVTSGPGLLRRATGCDHGLGLEMQLTHMNSPT